MSILCGWMAALVFIVGTLFSIDRGSIEYVIEFMLGAMFTLAVWAAVTL